MTEPNRPTPLVFLPGLLCDARIWSGQIAALADIADATIADLMQDDSIQAMAARTLAQAPSYFALAALSMGGYVAFEIMRQAPGHPHAGWPVTANDPMWGVTCFPSSPPRPARRQVRQHRPARCAPVLRRRSRTSYCRG